MAAQVTAGRYIGDDLERAARIAAENRRPMPDVGARDPAMVQALKERDEAEAHRYNEHLKRTAQQQLDAGLRRQRKKATSRLRQDHHDAIVWNQNWDRYVRQGDWKKLDRIRGTVHHMDPIELAHLQAINLNNKWDFDHAHRYEGPSLPDTMGESCYRYSARAMNRRVIRKSWVQSKRIYTFLQVVRRAREKGIYYYLCPNGGEHWHLTSHPEGDALPGNLTRRAQSDTVQTAPTTTAPTK